MSAVGAEEAVEALHCEAAAAAAAPSDSSDSEGGVVVFLHMGVDGGATEFKLEGRAMNEVSRSISTKLRTCLHQPTRTCHKADFRCPDERQHQPRQTPILAHHDEGLEHAYYSHLNLVSLVSQSVESMGRAFQGEASLI